MTCAQKRYVSPQFLLLNLFKIKRLNVMRVAAAALVLLSIGVAPALISRPAFAQTQPITAAFLTNDPKLPLPASNVPWSKYNRIIDCCIAPGPGDGSLAPGWLDTASTPTKLSLAKAAGASLIVSIIGSGGDWTNDTSPAYVASFANNIANYVYARGYDGVDLDWEASVNATQFNDLIQRLRSAMPDKIITMDVYDSSALLSVAKASSPALTNINVMCYDMGGYYATSWHNAAVLRGGSGRDTCDSRTGAFISQGVPASKLIVGLPAYGYAWTGCTAPFGSACTQGGSQLAYSTIIGNSTWYANGGNKRWDDTYKADYLSVASTNQFISYNDSQSVNALVTWGKTQGLGGYYILFLNQEYMSAMTGDARYPLSSALSTAVTGGQASAPSGDTTPPSVSITSPLNSATVSGNVTVSASASDNVGVTKLEFYLDGALNATDTTAPYTLVLNTTTLSNGSHSIAAKAYDAAGNTASSSVTVAVSNDATPPAVSITSPTSGATVSGTITVNASASDNVSVARVEFYVDGALKGQATSSPYYFPLDTGTLSNASHTLGAKAYDAAGNAGSASEAVLVSNATAPAPAPLVITNVAASTNSYSATITWTTSAPSTSQVEYGLNASYGALSQLDSNLVTTHTVVLSGLSRRTTYHFRVKSTDASGAQAVSPDYTFIIRGSRK